MAKFGWIEQWLGATSWQDHRQMVAINETATEIDSLAALQQDTAARTDKLFEADALQAKDALRMRATMEALIQLLIDNKLIDGKELQYRVEARMADLEPLPAPEKPRVEEPFDEHGRPRG